MDYREPTPLRIPRNKQTEELYRLEDALHEQVRRCAIEWESVWNSLSGRADAFDFYKHLLQRVLFDLLESYDVRAAMVAARAFLKAHEQEPL